MAGSLRLNLTRGLLGGADYWSDAGDVPNKVGSFFLFKHYSHATCLDLFLPRPRSRSPRKRTSERVSIAFVLSFVFPLVRFVASWDRPGRRAKGRLQRAAIAWTADGNWSKCMPP